MYLNVITKNQNHHLQRRPTADSHHPASWHPGIPAEVLGQ